MSDLQDVDNEAGTFRCCECGLYIGGLVSGTTPEEAFGWQQRDGQLFCSHACYENHLKAEIARLREEIESLWSLARDCDAAASRAKQAIDKRYSRCGDLTWMAKKASERLAPAKEAAP